MKRTVLASLIAMGGCASTPAPMQQAADYAVVECAASPDGRVSGCTVVEESQPGQGYGRMAIEAVARGRVVPKDPGSKVGTFRTTVRFGPGG